MSQIKYLPAISESLITNKKIVGKTVDFWHEDSLTKYDSALFSFAFFGKHRNFRQKIGYPKNKFFLADSGGFSVVTQGTKISPLELIEWLNNNADAGLILDIPPYSFSGTAQFGGNASQKFQASLQKTFENAEIMYKFWNKKFLLYSVIQGETYKQKFEWATKLKSIGEFSGCALSPKPSYNPYQIVSHIMLAKRLGYKNIHILQVTSKLGLCIIHYISRIEDHFNLMTYDSSTYSVGARWRLFFREPFNQNKIKLNSSFQGETTGCTCEACEELNKHIHKIKNDTLKMPELALLSLHGLIMQVKEAKIVEEMTTEQLIREIGDAKLIRFIHECTKQPERQEEIEKMFLEELSNNNTIITQPSLTTFCGG